MTQLSLQTSPCEAPTRTPSVSSHGCVVWWLLLLASHKSFEPLRRPPGATGGECGHAWGLNPGRLDRGPPR